MKLYILIEIPDSDTTMILGVFSSVEEVEKAVAGQSYIRAYKEFELDKINLDTWRGWK